jgi:hypothetical protein
MTDQELSTRRLAAWDNYEVVPEIQTSIFANAKCRSYKIRSIFSFADGLPRLSCRALRLTILDF